MSVRIFGADRDNTAPMIGDLSASGGAEQRRPEIPRLKMLRAEQRPEQIDQRKHRNSSDYDVFSHG
jgi:hypothetical protein